MSTFFQGMTFHLENNCSICGSYKIQFSIKAPENRLHSLFFLLVLSYYVTIDYSAVAHTLSFFAQIMISLNLLGKDLETQGTFLSQVLSYPTTPVICDSISSVKCHFIFAKHSPCTSLAHFCAISGAGSNINMSRMGNSSHSLNGYPSAQRLWHTT